MFTLLGIILCNAQEIDMKLSILGYKFTKDDERLTWNDVLNETQTDVKAHQWIKKAKSQNTISSILAFAGGGLIGVPLGQSISSREPNWTFAYIGAGITAIGIPLAICSFHNAKKGVEAYNTSLKSTTQYQFRPEFKIMVNGNGLGLSMHF